MKIPLFESASNFTIVDTSRLPEYQPTVRNAPELGGSFALAQAETQLNKTLMNATANLFVKIANARASNQYYKAQADARAAMNSLNETLAATNYENWAEVIDDARTRVYEMGAGGIKSGRAQRSYDRWFVTEYDNMRSRFQVQAASAQAQEVHNTRIQLVETAVQNGQLESALKYIQNGVMEGVFSSVKASQLSFYAQRTAPMNASFNHIAMELREGGVEAAMSALQATHVAAEEGRVVQNSVAVLDPSQLEELDDRVLGEVSDFKRLRDMQMHEKLSDIDAKFNEYLDQGVMTFSVLREVNLPGLKHADATALHEKWRRIIDNMNKANVEVLVEAGIDREHHMNLFKNAVHDRLTNLEDTRPMFDLAEEFSTVQDENGNTYEFPISDLIRVANGIIADYEDIPTHSEDSLEPVFDIIDQRISEATQNNDSSRVAALTRFRADIADHHRKWRAQAFASGKINDGTYLDEERKVIENLIQLTNEKVYAFGPEGEEVQLNAIDFDPVRAFEQYDSHTVLNGQRNKALQLQTLVQNKEMLGVVPAAGPQIAALSLFSKQLMERDLSPEVVKQMNQITTLDGQPVFEATAFYVDRDREIRNDNELRTRVFYWDADGGLRVQLLYRNVNGEMVLHFWDQLNDQPVEVRSIPALSNALGLTTGNQPQMPQMPRIWDNSLDSGT